MIYLIGFFLVFILILLVVIIFVFKRSKPQSHETPLSEIPEEVTISDLIKTLKTEKKDKSKVEKTLSTMVKSFPFPQNEYDANEHFKYVYFYAKNPLTDAKMIVNMQHRLSEANPKYAKQIETFQMQGVESRK